MALSRSFETMETDDHFCCQKTGLLKPKTFNILVGVTGSVAALKLPLLVSQLLQLPGVSYLNIFPSVHDVHFYTLLTPKPRGGATVLFNFCCFVIVVAKFSVIVTYLYYICNIIMFKCNTLASSHIKNDLVNFAVFFVVGCS